LKRSYPPGFLGTKFVSQRSKLLDVFFDGRVASTSPSMPFGCGVDEGVLVTD
jgi:hypothetical protein